jgi:methionyl-tRNA formyltransferase
LQGGKVLVSCGGGTRLELKEVQPAGKKAMPAVDWYRGLNKETKLD